jgi:hypothetical protein
VPVTEEAVIVRPKAVIVSMVLMPHSQKIVGWLAISNRS